MPFTRTATGEITDYAIKTPEFERDKECEAEDPFPWIKIGTSWLTMIYDMVVALRIEGDDEHNAKVDEVLENIEYG